VSPRPEPTPEEELRLRAAVKAELRTRMRAIRGALPKEARAARSAAIVERLAALPEFEAAATVAAFHPLRAEVDLRPLFARCADLGKSLCLPRVDLETNELVLHRWAPGDPLEEGPYGLKEPLAGADVVEPSGVDLLLCPALAVDERGHRIGYGGGYYDRLLARAPRTFACAVAFDFQRIAEAPVLPGDVAVAALVTDERQVSFVAPA
jgi:5-formyltetrahydrofolate cyclo-ligase